jgi:hypothetical protein
MRPSELTWSGMSVFELTDGEGRFVAAFRPRPSMPPMLKREFGTREEAEAQLQAWAERFSADERQRRKESEERARRERESFIARVRARHDEARGQFRRSRASVVVLDGIAYRRSEFRSLSRGQARRWRAPRRITRRPNGGRFRARARAPSSSEPEPPLQVVPLSRFRRDVRRWRGGRL